MLLQLNINNFALIKELTINFEKGFNVLTGETGAGKSILIDAINYVLGGKFNRSLIRIGENRTFVEAIFDIENTLTYKILDELEIDYDEIIIISRETFKSGKSVVKINGKSLLISEIKKIANTLINIHGQHENQELLNSGSHIKYLDKFGEEKLRNSLENYSKSFKDLKIIDKKINDIEISDSEKEKLGDFLKYQIEEIEKVNLKIGEDDELEEKQGILANSEKISEKLSYSYNMLYNSNEGFTSVYDILNKVVRELRTIENHMLNVKNIADSIEESYFNIEQNISEIRDMESKITYNPEELEFINSRIFQIDSLKRKYGSSIKEILEYKDKINIKYTEMTNSTKILEELKDKRLTLIDKMKKEAQIIHSIRVKIAKILEDEIKKQLDYVGLEKSIFDIQIKFQDEFYENGCDRVQFLITTNPGQPLKPLEKVVSGGELSRIMLSIKTVFVDKDDISSVIFDEIDTGISGRIAQRVAEKMYLISQGHQVFCVTHLPQIASMSDFHFLVSKDVENEVTYTTISKLHKDKKEYEIARMIGGTEITDLTLQNSREMVKLAVLRKEKLILNAKNS